MEVLSGWGMDTDSRLYFRKNYAKYEFFRKPLVSVWSCFSPFYFWYDPVHLHYCNHWRVYFIIVGFFPRSHGFHIPWNERDHGSFPAHTGTRCSNLWCSFIPRLTIRRLLFDVKICFPIFRYSSQTFLKSSSCPEIHGHLHAKELSRKSWKKSYFILRRSGLYFSNKGTSKVRRNKYLKKMWIKSNSDKQMALLFFYSDFSLHSKHTGWNNSLVDHNVLFVHHRVTSSPSVYLKLCEASRTS